MFRKLLKHDLKSVGRVCLPITIGAIILSVFGLILSGVHVFLNEHTSDLFHLSLEAYEAGNEGLSTLFDILYTAAHLTNFASVLTMFFVVVVFMGLGTTVMVLVVVNFYKTLITDQGYLTFTLPVSPTKIYLSKIINGTIWSTVISLVTVLGIALMLVPSLIFDSSSLTGDLLNAIVADVHPINLILMIFLYVVVWFVGSVVTLIYYFFAVFLGGVITPKGKFVTGAAFIIVGHIAYYIFQQVISFIITFASLFASALFSNEIIDTITITNITMLISFISLLIIGTVFFFLTKWLMNKKLNLP